MKVKDFYLIESIDTSILEKPQRQFLEEQLTLFQTGLSLIEKTKAINKIINNYKLKSIRYLYNEWLFSFVTEQLEKAVTEEEAEHLLKMLGNCYIVSGEMHFYKSNYDKALNSFVEAVKIREKQGDKELLLSTYHNISSVYERRGDVTSALETYEKSAPLLKYVKKKEILARYYINIASIFHRQGNNLKSLDYCYKGLEICEENNYENESALIYGNIGMLMVLQDDLEGALQYYLKALELHKKNNNEYGESCMYDEIGVVYEKRKENNKALSYFAKAVQIQKRLDLKEMLSYSYLQIGIVYENQNKLPLAFEYYYKSLKISKKIGLKDKISQVLCKTGTLEIKNGAIEKAQEQILLAFTLAREIGDPELIRDASAAKINLAISMGNYKLAFEMEQLKNEMKDTIQNEEIKKELIKRKYQYEKDKALLNKDLEIEVERKNALLMGEQSDLLELKNEELASKNNIINKQMLELEELIQKLQESNESLNQFAAVAAHDLKAPLRNIQGFSQLLHKKFTGQLPEQDMALFMHIINSCTSLKELIDGLLNYSKISNIKLELACVDLSQLTVDVKNNLSNIIKETKVVLHIADGLPKVTGQYSLLFQVVLNFINNAIKFRKKEDGLQPEIWIESENYKDGQTKISIKDNGIGIEKEHQNKIFGIFKKLHSSTEYEGSGIGLSVCKKIIERLGGKVWLESNKNVGTTFFFTLRLSA